MNKRAFISVVISGLLLAAVLLTGLAIPASAGNATPGAPMDTAPDLGATPLPSSVNLSNELPAVGDQTDIGPGCQYCHTWSCTYYMLTQYVKHFLHPEWDLSNPEHIFGPSFCCYEGGDHYVLQNQGDLDMAEMPYDPSLPESGRPTPAQIEAAKQYRISGYSFLWDYGQQTEPPFSTTDAAITNAKAWIASGHVLDVGIDAYSDFPLQHNHSQDTHFYDPAISPPHTIGHYVNFVGYNDNINPSGVGADHKGGFLMVNCWGPNWNGDMHGYIWMSYAYVKQCVTDCSVITSMPSDTPSVTGCNTNSGKVGDTVVISGNNFGTNRRQTKVTFNGVTSQIDGWVNDSIITSVPWDVTSGPLVVHDWEDTHSNSFEFTVNHSAPTIASMIPDSGAAGNALIMPDLTGANFFGTPVVELRKAGQADIVASSVQVTSSTNAICSFDLQGAAPGSWDLCLKNPDGQSAAKPGVFTVTAPTWYLAEGTTAWGFNTYITIENPNTSGVTAKLTYMDPNPSSGAGVLKTRTINLPPEAQTTVDPRWDLGNTDFSTKVECLQGKTIAVDRTMFWTGKGAPSPEGHGSIGVTSPSTTWYLPEGSSAWGFETWTLVENPNPTVTNVTITYMTQDAMQKVVHKTVPACSRASYSMAADLGLQADASIKVQSDVPVIAEGSTYRNNKREGSSSVGATAPSTDCFLSEGSTAWGFTTYVLVENPNDQPTDVTLTYMTPTGPKTEPAFTMSANSRKTIRVNDALANTDFSTKVHGTRPIIASRSMYWGAGTPLGEACHSSIGLTQAHMTFYLPDGQTSNGHETYTLVANPNPTAATVRVSYLPQGGGKTISFTDEIGAGSRKTYDMGDKIPSGRASVMVQSLDVARPIIVERSMYWNNKGAGTNTIGACSD